MFDVLVLLVAPIVIATLLAGALSRARSDQRRAFTLAALISVWGDGVLFAALVSVMTPTPVTLVGWMSLIARDAVWALLVARALLAVARSSDELRVARLARLVSEASSRTAAGSARRRGVA